jgi:predicted Zn-dependent protease
VAIGDRAAHRDARTHRAARAEERVSAASLDELIGALRANGDAAEWVATSRAREVARVRHGAAEERGVDARVELGAIVHRDLPSGRGSARLAVIGGAIGPPLDEAIDRAGFAVGPPWRMAPQAAPAQVEVADPAVEGAPADVIAERIGTRVYAAARAPAIAKLAGAAMAVDDVEVVIVRDTIDLASSQGLHARWRATEVQVRAQVSAGGRTAIAVARARSLDGLGLAAAIAAAAERIGARDRAVAIAPGAYPIVLRMDALAPPDGGLGVWAAFAAQADAALVRQGLSRYRPGRPIVDDAATGAEPLTIVSDGTLRYGLASVPLGDEAEPVRRFALVERGVAREVAYDQREAALAGARPNGGVRNVVVDPGSTSAAALAAGPVLDVASLAWIEIDPRTAELAAGIELAYLRDAAGAATPIVGGVIRGDAIAALAHATRSSETAARGAYAGPIAIRTPPLDVS